MNKIKNQFEVILPLPFNKGFIYGVNNDLNINIGDVVLIPFRGRNVVGVVWQKATTRIDDSKLKFILKKFESNNFSEELRKFIQWVSSYTMSSIGQVIKMSLANEDTFLFENTIDIYRLKNPQASKITDKRKLVIESLTNNSELEKKQIEDLTNVSSNIINSMVKQGFIEKISIQKPIEQNIKPTQVSLSSEQEEAFKILETKIDNNNFSVNLIDGVTGSGKTEVYLNCIEKILKQKDSQALILLPEIILTDQLILRLKERFGFSPTKWHSGLTQKQKKINYQAICNGSSRLIIGARSSLFLPYKNLKLIVIDEEHDTSFKQEEGVIYNARDMSVIRAKIENFPLILASATPSIETLNNVKSGKYNLVTLKKRHGKAIMPTIEIVDMREEKIGSQKWISSKLIEKIEKQIKNNKQSLLFLNRRGYAPLTLCSSCGYRFQCKNCSSWLVQHHNPSKLVCHHCGYWEKPTNICPKCNKEDCLVGCGPGVQRIEQEAKLIFEEANIVVLTSDLTENLSKTKETLKKIKEGHIDIIIGTQMIAKGHNFPNLDLVGIIDADLGLQGGDPRASEKTFQLLQQVSGRAGRYGNKGEVIIQSYIPDNKVIKALANDDRDNFLEVEIKSRKMAQMPPFSKLVALVLSGKKANEVLNIAKRIIQLAPYDEKIMILGPIESQIFLLNKNYRYRILIKTENSINIQEWLSKLLLLAKIPKHIRLKVDIDPIVFS